MSFRYWGLQGYVIKNLAWFDELQLRGWDLVKEYYEEDENFLYEAFDATEEFITEYLDLEPSKAKALVDALDLMCKDFKAMTGLDLDVVNIDSDCYTYDDIEPGVYFSADGVTHFTPAGMSAIQAEKIEYVTWVCGG